MKTSFVETVKYAGEARLCYSVECEDGIYNLRVTASPAKVESVYVRDIARDSATAEKLCDLFARNLVFPGNVYEILDDILGTDFFR